MKIIFDYNRTIFDPDASDLYPGILELLQKLSLKYELFLISRYEPSRKNRFNELNIENYFQQILFVNEKSKQIFEKIAGNTKDVIVVGDSISDEIKIGNQLGFFTIRIKKGKFGTSVPQNKDEIAKLEIANIKNLEDIILNYEK